MDSAALGNTEIATYSHLAIFFAVLILFLWIGVDVLRMKDGLALIIFLPTALLLSLFLWGIILKRRMNILFARANRKLLMLVNKGKLSPDIIQDVLKSLDQFSKKAR